MRKKLRVGVVSTYRVQCGVSLHIENITNETSKLVESMKIFAEHINPPDKETPPRYPENPVEFERCWRRGERFDNLQAKILEYSPDIVEIQFNAGLMSEGNYNPNSHFQHFVSNLKDKGIKVVFYVHDVPKFICEGYYDSQQLYQWYKKIDVNLISGNPFIKEGILKWYPEAKIFEIPVYVPKTTAYPKEIARKALNLRQEDFLITQLGFYGINKGMKEIIEAIPNIPIPNLKIVFAGSLHPFAMDSDKVYMMECIRSAIKNKITKDRKSVV